MGGLAGFRIERTSLRQRLGSPALAENRDHYWVVRGLRFLRADCEGRITVHFEHSDGTTSQIHGPHNHLSAVDGTLYLDREIFASYQEGTGVWCCDPVGSGWPIVVVNEA